MTEYDELFAENFFSANFKKDDFIVGICPSGGWPSKKCDPEIFARISDRIISEFNAKIVILWGPGDENDADVISNKMNNLSVMIPPSSICQLGAIIKKCKILVANDSGPMHIATAVGTPVLSLHGPTSPYLQGPFGNKHEWYRLEGLACIECNLLECNRNHECFKEMEINSIVEKLNKLIHKNNIVLNEKT
jgi:ADP-heptose:LPS heptosyltransferase